MPLAASLTLLAAVTTTAVTTTAVAAAPTPQPARATDPQQCALPGQTGWTDEGHNTDPVQFLKPSGRIRTLMLFADFPDAPADGPTSTYADHLKPAAEWLDQASYGEVALDITPLDRWLRMPRESTTYGFDRGITFEQHEQYVRDAVTAADPHVDFSSYDLVYIVPPKTAAAVSFSPTYLFAPATPGVVADGTRIKWAVTFGQDMWHWGYEVAPHETGHTFGLPDLYSFTGPDIHRHVGGWDVMGDISGAAPHPLGWHSWKLGWSHDEQVVCLPGPGEVIVPLTAVEQPGGNKIAVVRTGPTTAFVAESRRATGLDAASCSSGVLIYRVDAAIQTGQGPVQVLDAQPSTTPDNGCKPLDDGAFLPGQSFTDPQSGVRIEVLDSGDTGDTVRVSRAETDARLGY
ncbi:M6 family metalloprotease domain-containing protein [Saccharopolyspora sp. 5N102]|uniref:M6 family metalloprotease domain-containing protein n=1 Tax=Saccharopolyspora sp. 5N102 TaxID=3375155 RepID=UPI0037AAB60C